MNKQKSKFNFNNVHIGNSTFSNGDFNFVEQEVYVNGKKVGEGMVSIEVKEGRVEITIEEQK